MGPAMRDDAAAFRADWTALIETKVWPALRRYRDFLRDEYRPRARASVSLEANPNGLACYRATVYANTTVDGDARELFKAASARAYGARACPHAGQKGLRRESTGLACARIAGTRRLALGFSSSNEIAAYAQATVARASAAIGRMVRDPPSAAMKVEPFPEFMQRSGPGGEYVPGADDGSRLPTFYFRDDPARQSRGPFEVLVFHETLPGHHLQAAVLAQNQRAALHPITRVLWFSGPGEGWATYAEGLARELGLYTSDFEVICALMSDHYGITRPRGRLPAGGDTVRADARRRHEAARRSLRPARVPSRDAGRRAAAVRRHAEQNEAVAREAVRRQCRR